MCGKHKLERDYAASLIDKHKHLKRYYHCSLSDSFHVTKSPKSLFPLDSQERPVSMATVGLSIRDRIIRYMETLYAKEGTFKVTSRMVKDALPAFNKGTVSAEISNMKKAGVITALEESTPNQSTGRDIQYFALSSVLDKVTEPTSKVPVIPTQVKEEPKPMATTPVKPTVANPFERMEAKLELMFTQLKGLAQGYTEVATNLKHVKEGAVTQDTVDITSESTNRIVNSVVLRLQADLDNTDSSIKELTRAVALSVNTPSKINPTDTHWIVNTVVAKMQPSIENILRAMENVGNPPIPANASAEYKEAFKEGIKFAIENGLMVRDVT